MAKSDNLMREEVTFDTTRWVARPESLAIGADFPETILYQDVDVKRFSNDLVMWDVWPLQYDNGDVAEISGGDLWIILSAPAGEDPDARHNKARMRLLFRNGETWIDCGNVFEDGYSPGSREWSGSARLEPDTRRVTLWFTASGRRGESGTSFEQRLFHSTGTLDTSAATPRIVDWRDLTQTVCNDGRHYADVATTQGVPGQIKGFRDPYWFRDPANGQGYFLFTGSKTPASSESAFDGVIGIAVANDHYGLAEATLMPALIDGDAQVNEMERPHVFVHDGLYYLFWSTQSHVFAAGSLKGPTGLYGMVAPSLFGPYTPLNGSGLVLANNRAEPRQAYAWQVTPALEVFGFVDYWGLEGRDTECDPELKIAQFGGTIAPVARIELNGTSSRIVEGGA